VPLNHQPSWLAKAACRREQIDLFFPISAKSSGASQLICSTCLAKSECLSYALDHRELSGIWGGTSEEQRVFMRRAAG
jgi:WhiB family redox-sensing transcriptional regulator